MIRKIIASAIAVPAAGVLALAGSASASSDSHGAYHQNTGGLRCTGQVHDNGDGGTMSVVVSGREVRPQSDHFRTGSFSTRLVAEEKTYNGTWVPVKYAPLRWGHLGPSYDAGAKNVSPFVWNGKGAHPRLRITVAGHDDLFRVRVVTRVYSDEGALLARLVTREGSCRL
jgi:hypothetical protein